MQCSKAILVLLMIPGSLCEALLLIQGYTCEALGELLHLSGQVVVQGCFFLAQQCLADNDDAIVEFE